MTPFVGRGRELQALEEHWAAAQAGALQVARVVGDAGIGKSRLVRELKRALEAKGNEVFELRCAPEHSNSAFQSRRPSTFAAERAFKIGGSARTSGLP